LKIRIFQIFVHNLFIFIGRNFFGSKNLPQLFPSKNYNLVKQELKEGSIFCVWSWRNWSFRKKSL